MIGVDAIAPDAVAHAFASGLAAALSWPALACLVAGIVVGAIVGLLPGFGGPAMLAVLLPFTWSLDPLSAFALLVGAMSVTATTGDVTAILLGVPGESISTAIVADGHAFARTGQAGRAIGAALTSSLIGTVFGAVVLAVAIPLARPLMLAIGSPELFMLSVAGITFIAPLAGSVPLKGLLSGVLGLFVATIGLDPMDATPRFTFGSLALWDGVGVLAVGLGLFAVPEAIALATDLSTRTPVARARVHGVGDGIRDALSHWKLVLRCSAIGSYVGMLPGVGASVSQWIAYAHAVGGRRSVDRSAPSIEGVLGPGAANNATLGGALIPTLAFGIPGSVLTAIFLSALVAKGVVPGEAILKPEADGGRLSLVFSFVAFLVLANVLTTAVFIRLSGVLGRIADIRGHLLFPVVVVLTVLGAFMERNALADLGIVAAAGALGVMMVRLDWPRPPLLLGLALGGLAENRLFLATSLYGWTWILRPGVVLIALVTLVALVLPRWRAGRPQGPAPSQTSRTRSIGDAAFALGLVVVAVAGLALTASFPARPALFPRVILAALLILALALLVFEFRRPRGSQPSPTPASSAPGGRWTAVAWIGGFLLCAWVAGPTIGLSTAVFAYLRIRAHAGWLTSLVQAIVVVLMIDVVLGRVLTVPLPPGLLWPY